MSYAAYFFDTYAFFEIIRGNSAYKTYRDAMPIITILNLAELNYGLKRDYDKETADRYTLKFAEFSTEIILEDVDFATDMKLEEKSLSFADILGYAVAKRLNVKFLTGDEKFRNKENVEFVK